MMSLSLSLLKKQTNKTNKQKKTEQTSQIEITWLFAIWGQRGYETYPQDYRADWWGDLDTISLPPESLGSGGPSIWCQMTQRQKGA